MPKIFISYRRSDSEASAGRIYDQLVAAFGANQVFKDVHNIKPGSDFRGRIREAVANSDIVLVLIGKDWLNAVDQEGNRRLDNPGDWVRIEVETGLQRDTALVIPVLLGNASMPSESELPAALGQLAYKNAAIVRNDPDFHNDMKRLIRHLQGDNYTDAPPPAPSGGTNIEQNIGTMSGGTVIGNQLNIGKQPPTPQGQSGTTPPPLPPDSTVPKRPSIPVKSILGVLGTLIAIMLAALALFSEEWRNDAFYKLGLYTATPTLAEVIAPSNTPTDIPAIPTDTDTPPSSTAAPSDTPISTTSVPASDTPPSPSNTPVPQTQPIILPVDETNLRLFMTRESFTLVVDEAANLNGLEFRVVGRTETLTGFFDILQLTGGMAQAGDCYVLVRDGAAPPLAGACAVPARTFKRDVAPADVFWFDTLTGLYRDIAIYQGEASTGQVCPGSEEGCEIRYGS